MVKSSSLKTSVGGQKEACRGCFNVMLPHYAASKRFEGYDSAGLRPHSSVVRGVRGASVSRLFVSLVNGSACEHGARRWKSEAFKHQTRQERSRAAGGKGSRSTRSSILRPSTAEDNNATGKRAMIKSHMRSE